jgi:hypothetical protein
VGLDGHQGEPLQAIDEKILKGGHIGGLAANADLGAALAFRRLFALVTKHDKLLSFEVLACCETPKF